MFAMRAMHLSCIASCQLVSRSTAGMVVGTGEMVVAVLLSEYFGFG